VGVVGARREPRRREHAALLDRAARRDLTRLPHVRLRPLVEGLRHVSVPGAMGRAPAAAALALPPSRRPAAADADAEESEVPRRRRRVAAVAAADREPARAAPREEPAVTG